MTNEELVRLIQSGQQDKLLELWYAVESLIQKRANDWAHTNAAVIAGAAFDDFYQSGFLAFVSAVETYNGYDPERGYSFITHLQHKMLAEFANVSGLRTQRQKRDPVRYALDIDAPWCGSDSKTFADVISDPAAFDAIEDIIKRDELEHLHSDLEKALSRLPAPQQTAIRIAYYGFPGTLDEKAHRKAIRTLRRPEISRDLRQYVAPRRAAAGRC